MQLQEGQDRAWWQCTVIAWLDAVDNREVGTTMVEAGIRPVQSGDDGISADTA